MRVELDELVLIGAPDDVPRARHFASALLRAWGASELIDDGALAVTELVTNALLHAGPPVTLRLLRTPPGVRVEVVDPSRAAPVRPLADVTSMTGRGLSLVEAMGHRWGIEPREHGKVIWVELDPAATEQPNQSGVDAVLATWDDGDRTTGKQYTVRLGDVPTDLLLAAKAHVDNLVREFVLAAGGAASGSTGRIPKDLAELIETVTHRFAEPRLAIKRQALAAAARGDLRTELTLTLPASAADAGEAYLRALDAADSYARAARLLTLETPPQHRVFRRWYVESLVEHLRHASRGEPVAPAPSFERRLLDELSTVAAANRASQRAARMQAATAALAGASTAEEVAQVVLTEGVQALGAYGGGLFVPTEGELLALPGALGYGDALVERLRAEDRFAELPAAAALRTGEAVWLESRQDRDSRFPGLAEVEPETMAMCAVPLRLTGRVLGALRFSFAAPRLFDDEERQFVLALAAQTAQALERATLYTAERAARKAAEAAADRLARLQQVTSELTAAPDIERIADIVVTHAADALGAQVATVSVLVDDQTLRVIRARGVRPETAQRWQTFRLDADVPASEALRTNSLYVARSRDEVALRFPHLESQLQDNRVLVCAPLSVNEHRIGVVSLSFPPGHDIDDPGERGFLTALSDACAQALERAMAMQRASEATEKLTFLAAASAELGGSLDFRTTLSNVARLVVPRLADWCAISVLEDGEVRSVAVAHVDPEKVVWAQELQDRYPSDPDAPTGVPNVIRTGTSELYPEIPHELLVAGAVDEEHLRIILELGLSSALTVPLTGRQGTFGAITMIYAESGRHYNKDDLAFAEDLARRAAVAVENADAYSRQTGRLAAVLRVAEAAQRAILAPAPERVGPVALSAAYVSAAKEALIGGDLYEVLRLPGSVRLLIGDVRGKGLDAVRLATVVLGQFRSAAVDHPDLTAVARQMDERVRAYLGDEDFITALLVDIGNDGTCTVANCGHPPALLAVDGRIEELGAIGSLPLGLGARPETTSTVLPPGARLLLYTDGLLEARGPDGQFIDRDCVVAPLTEGDLTTVLDRILAVLRGSTSDVLGDDLALLVAEFRGGPGSEES